MEERDIYFPTIFLIRDTDSFTGSALNDESAGLFGNREKGEKESH